MKLHELKEKFNNKKKKRLGRGNGSGKGTTAGRGTKGQKSRSGGKLRPGFEGGQTPLLRRIPKKRGFRSNAVKPQIVNVLDLEKLKAGAKVNKELLYKEGIIKNKSKDVKILGKGKLEKKLVIDNLNVSKNAQDIIKKAGGEILTKVETKDKVNNKKRTKEETK